MKRAPSKYDGSAPHACELLHTRWDAATWPIVTSEFQKALALKNHVQRAGWFN
jgi:hypothetical protein